MIESDCLTVDLAVASAGPLPPGLDPYPATAPHHRWKAAQRLGLDAAWQVTPAADALLRALAGIEARRERVLLPWQARIRALAAAPVAEPVRRGVLATLLRLQAPFALADLLVQDPAATLRETRTSSGLLCALCDEIDGVVACAGPQAGQFSRVAS